MILSDMNAAYSATIVLPDPVGTAANTECLLSIESSASFCHGSSGCLRVSSNFIWCFLQDRH